MKRETIRKSDNSCNVNGKSFGKSIYIISAVTREKQTSIIVVNTITSTSNI